MPLKPGDAGGPVTASEARDAAPEAGPAVPGAAPTAPELAPGSKRFELGGRSLREHTARGALINTAFSLAMVLVMLVQRVGVAAFLTTTEYGFWGLLLATILTLTFLKQVGIQAKYVQQSEEDQEVAFQKAFTLEFIASVIFFAFVVAVLPLYALAYGRTELIFPGIVLSTALLTTAFQAPIWISYRQMRFVRQRLLESLLPVVSTIVILALAIAGAGYWSLIIGTVVGQVAASLGAVLSSPFRLRFRFDMATTKSYFGFSWPLFVAQGSNLLVSQGAIIIANFTVGLAGLGAIALAAAFLGFIDRVDDIIRRTMYPAVCSVADRADLMKEAFSKSNRLTLMWSLPVGAGMALFAGDLVNFVLGEQWEPAVPLLQSFGVVLAVRQIAFNWSLFFSAIGQTRPMAVHGVATLIGFVVITVPLMFSFDLLGYAAGMAGVTVVQIAVRSHYLSKLFGGFDMLGHIWRSVWPVIPPVALILGLRVLGYERDLIIAVAELALFSVAVIGTAWLSERGLLRETVSYLKRRSSSAAAA